MYAVKWFVLGILRNRKLLVHISNYGFRSLEWWYSRGEVENPCITENVIVHVERRNCAGEKRRLICLQNNPTIDLLIFLLVPF